jgi:protoheme IX farnesyltransferase
MNSVIKNYYELCKPNVVLMMLITALVGSLLASKTLAPLSLIAFAMLGIGLCASSAAAINQIIDRKADANMNRTENRPIPQGEVSPINASIFAFILGSLGAAILVIYVNTLTAFLTLASLIGYAFIYTVYLKRATPQNIVIGGLAGAAPPLLGWTAVTNSIDPNSLLLVLIIFAWTPPHCWALAIHRKDDYAKENIPMLPVTHGVQFTKLQIILYTIILILVSLLPFVVMMSGILYFISAVILGVIFLYYAVRLYFDEDSVSAFPTFVYSIYYIFLIFAALLIDHYIV